MFRHELRVIFFIILAFGIFGGTSNPAQAQKSEKRCPAPINVSMKRHTLPNAIGAVLKAFDQPMHFGLVYPNPLRPWNRLTLNFDACSIEEAFDRITKEHGGYRWTFNEGVVNFTPTTHEKVDLNWFLSYKLDKCYSKAKRLSQAKILLLQQLHDLDLPVRLDAMPSDIEEGPHSVSMREYKVTLSTKGTTIGQCLNYLILAAPGEAFWLLVVDKGLVTLATNTRNGQGFWDTNLLKSEFSSYIAVTDRLAELRGVQATRELTKVERKEQRSLRQKYESLMELVRQKRH